MSDDAEGTVVRVLGPDDWRTWRDIRLRSLADAPEAFGSTLARERDFAEEDWLRWLTGVAVLATVDGVPAALGGGYRVQGRLDAGRGDVDGPGVPAPRARPAASWTSW